MKTSASASGPKSVAIGCEAVRRTYSHSVTIVHYPQQTAQEQAWGWASDKLVGPLTVGIVIALAGVAIARMNERFKAKREYLAKSVEDLRSGLADLREVTSSYWCSAYNPVTSPGQEAEIEYRLQDLSGLIAVCAPALWVTSDDRGPDLIAALAGAAAPAGFADPSRLAAPQNARETAAAAAAISYELAIEMANYHNAPFHQRWGWRAQRWWRRAQRDSQGRKLAKARQLAAIEKAKTG